MAQISQPHINKLLTQQKLTINNAILSRLIEFVMANKGGK